MLNAQLKVQAVRPDREFLTRQRLPYFIGISGQTVGSSGLSMHLVVIPPGARAEPHIHLGYETGIYVLEGTVLTRWGADLENETVSQTGDFLFIPLAYRTRLPWPRLVRWLRATTLRSKTGSNRTPSIALWAHNREDVGSVTRVGHLVA
jgi:uncharacterized RmlC-like cupin family protein